jgi:hypothetical protein
VDEKAAANPEVKARRGLRRSTPVHDNTALGHRTCEIVLERVQPA